MNEKQIAAIGSMVVTAEQEALVIMGGVRALVALFHSGAETPEQLDADIAAVEANAIARRDQRQREIDAMGGAPA